MVIRWYLIKGEIMRWEEGDTDVLNEGMYYVSVKEGMVTRIDLLRMCE